MPNPTSSQRITMKKTFKLSASQSFIQLAINSIAMILVIAIMPGLSSSSNWAVLFAVILMSILNWITQPIFSFLARIFGIIGLLALSLFANAFIMAFVFWFVRQISSDGFWTTFWASWFYAIIITLANWAIVSRSQDVFLADILRRPSNSKQSKNKKTGFVFIQLDGVSAPVLDWQIKAGNMPNIDKLLRQDGYVFNSWRTQIPSTTPASQAGILFRSNDNIPAFRWYEKSSGKMLVANQFHDASLIEKRLSNGKGLLADGGVSIGNLFSGDAPSNIMVMSKVAGDRQSLKTMDKYVSFFTTPMGFMRALILSLAEMIKEVYQSRRAIAKDIQPRVKRGFSYIILRAVTNVILRDMQSSIIIKNMQQGVNSIYVDFLDYDEIAHHAGFARPESLAALSGLDGVVGLLSKARNYIDRPYEIILLSDHGQSQGPTFEQFNDGVSLESLVLELLGEKNHQITKHDSAEDDSALRTLLSHESSKSGIESKIAKSLSKKFDKNHSKDKKEQASDIISNRKAVVTGSGNLGNIWLTQYNGRATLEDIENDYPKLISKLIKNKGIGFVVLRTKSKGLICIGLHGKLDLINDKTTGQSPLLNYPEGSQADLVRLANMKTAPDIIVMSSYDKSRDEVYAFEGLVGNHGGLGGWQTEAVLLHPYKYSVDPRHLINGRIRGAHTVNRILIDWLQQEGQHK